jgi:hypothetical protein
MIKTLPGDRRSAREMCAICAPDGDQMCTPDVRGTLRSRSGAFADLDVRDDPEVITGPDPGVRLGMRSRIRSSSRLCSVLPPHIPGGPGAARRGPARLLIVIFWIIRYQLI